MLVSIYCIICICNSTLLIFYSVKMLFSFSLICSFLQCWRWGCCAAAAVIIKMSGKISGSDWWCNSCNCSPGSNRWLINIYILYKSSCKIYNFIFEIEFWVGRISIFAWSTNILDTRTHRIRSALQRNQFIFSLHRPHIVSHRSSFVGSESGPKQSVKLLQNMVYSTIQHSPPPPRVTHCLFIQYI